MSIQLRVLAIPLTLKRVLVAAHDALESAADSKADNKIPEVDTKFEVAFDLLYHFVKGFATLNPNSHNPRFMELTDFGIPSIFRLSTGRSPSHDSHFTDLCSLRRNIDSFVGFPSASLYLNTDEF